MNMVRDLGVLAIAGTLGMNMPAFEPMDYATQPQSLSEYVEAAQDGSLQPDPVVAMVSHLCPAILKASEDQNNPYASQMSAACGMLMASQVDTQDLLAMVE